MEMRDETRTFTLYKLVKISFDYATTITTENGLAINIDVDGKTINVYDISPEEGRRVLVREGLTVLE